MLKIIYELHCSHCISQETKGTAIPGLLLFLAMLTHILLCTSGAHDLMLLSLTQLKVQLSPCMLNISHPVTLLFNLRSKSLGINFFSLLSSAAALIYYSQNLQTFPELTSFQSTLSSSSNRTRRSVSKKELKFLVLTDLEITSHEVKIFSSLTPNMPWTSFLEKVTSLRPKCSSMFRTALSGFWSTSSYLRKRMSSSCSLFRYWRKWVL